MSSPTVPHQEPYDYQRPSSTATRALVDPSSSPTYYHTPAMFPPNSHHELIHEASTPKLPHLHRRKTNNYEEAMTNRAVASAAASSEHDHEHKPDAGAVAHPGFGRQQSWKESDQKRVAMEHILGSEDPKSPNYTSGKPAGTK